MARARAAAVLALAVCCLLAATAPARRPADLPPRELDAVVDREAAVQPVRDAGRHDAAADQRTAVLVPEEPVAVAVAVAVREEDPARGERPRHRPSLLCLVFRCGGEPAESGSALVARHGSSGEPTATVGWARPAVHPVEADDEEAREERAYENETDSDSDSDSDSDDEDEHRIRIRILGWLWRLADRF